MLSQPLMEKLLAMRLARHGRSFEERKNKIVPSTNSVSSNDSLCWSINSGTGARTRRWSED